MEQKNTEQDNQLVTTQGAMTTLDIINSVVSSGLSLEHIDRMMDLHERNERNEARKAYHKAFAAFKADPPKIIKDMKVEHSVKSGGTKSYDHASIGNVVSSIISGMGGHGLSHKWEIAQTNDNVTIKCILTHELGHSESTEMTAPPDPSGGKNTIQAIASTITYLQRYTILSITGMATNEFENDGMSDKIPAEKILAGIDWFVAENKTPDALEKWLNSLTSSVEFLSPKDQELIVNKTKEAIDKLIVTESKLSEPATTTCPNSGLEVTATECEQCKVEGCNSNLFKN